MPEMIRTILFPGARFNEMVLYPQVQDALFYGEPMPLSEARKLINSGSYRTLKYHHSLINWNIRWNNETTEDFRKNNERFSTPAH